MFFVPLEEDNLELVRNWRNQEEIRNFMFTNHIISQEEHRTWYNRIKKNPSVEYWIFSEDDAKKAGLVYLYNVDLINRLAFWGIYIGDLSLNNKGIGSKVQFAVLDYVFIKMALNKLSCEVFTFNNKALHFYKKFGFVEEDLFKQQVFRDGQHYDVLRLTMFRDDWLNKHRKRMKTILGINTDKM